MVRVLQKKIFRDTRENRWAFLSIVCICPSGTTLFSGINLYVSTVENEMTDYYEKVGLVDYRAYKADTSEFDLDHLRSFTDIQEAQRRKITGVALPEASNSVLHLRAVDEVAKISVPELLVGSLLDGSETDALLLDSRFAQAHGLSVGDMVTIREDELQKEWWIKGIVRDTEYAYYAPEGLTVLDYHRYGFTYTNASTLPDIAYNELTLIVCERPKFSQKEQPDQIREAFESVMILSCSHQTSYCKVVGAITGIKQIRLLFPIALFLTAALVTWITVSRMTEDQR